MTKIKSANIRDYREIGRTIKELLEEGYTPLKSIPPTMAKWNVERRNIEIYTRNGDGLYYELVDRGEI